MTILYAEDDIDDFEFFHETLKSIDGSHVCFNVLNGKEALEFLENSAIVPDVIFLDINMPIVDGRACLKEIKKDERLRSIPVFIFSSSTNPQEKQLCQELGAAGFLPKPTNQEAATHQLREALQSIPNSNVKSA